MLTNKNTTTYRLKEETNAMGAAQIMLGLIHNALATLWISLYHVEDKKYSIGSKLMLVSICYLLVSGALFINSGASSITQGSSSIYQFSQNHHLQNHHLYSTWKMSLKTPNQRK
ncbi:uncharacterized protein Ms4a20 isoform X4 [Rattus norvegicus]|uniref:uncharacterized protein LOC102557108 isoform d n=1 Tax=Rattus norvegicus TaxID=10116 RepID=UPI002FD846C4